MISFAVGAVIASTASSIKYTVSRHQDSDYLLLFLDLCLPCEAFKAKRGHLPSVHESRRLRQETS